MAKSGYFIEKYPSGHFLRMFPSVWEEWPFPVFFTDASISTVLSLRTMYGLQSLLCINVMCKCSFLESESIA